MTPDRLDMQAGEAYNVTKVTKDILNDHDKLITLDSEVETIRTLLGYKDKRNGEFRACVEKEQDNIFKRLGTLESSVNSQAFWLKMNMAMYAGLFSLLLYLVYQHIRV